MTGVLAVVAAKPTVPALVAGRLVGLGVDALLRRPAVRYRLNLVRHPLHVRLSVPAHLAGCFCDRREVRS